MAGGPIYFAGILGLRSIAPLAYANPFTGGLVSWVGDPMNTWHIVSYATLALVACSAVWLVDGAMTFFETRTKTAMVATAIIVWLLVIAAQGGKFNPLDWKELTTAGLVVLAYLSACGRFFSRTEDQKETK